MPSAGAADGQGTTVRVLVVDDHDLFRSGLATLLSGQPDIDVVGEAGDGLAAVRLGFTPQGGADAGAGRGHPRGRGGNDSLPPTGLSVRMRWRFRL